MFDATSVAVQSCGARLDHVIGGFSGRLSGIHTHKSRYGRAYESFSSTQKKNPPPENEKVNAQGRTLSYMTVYNTLGDDSICGISVVE